MAKPSHTRVTFRGHIGGAASVVEEWSFNVNFPDSAVADDATEASLVAKAEAMAGAWHDYIRPWFGSDVWLDEVRVAAVDGSGHVIKRADGSYVQGDSTTPYNGTQAHQPMPLQTALCVSLGTARSGPTGKGRFFLPWPALSLDADSKTLPEAQAQTAIDNTQSFLVTLAGTMGTDPVVVSSKGYTSPVTFIRVGRVPDTMRSRREDIPEGYLTKVLHP